MSNLKDVPSQEEKNFSLLKIILSVFCVVALRMFLDNFAYPNVGEYFLPLERFVHAPLYFFSVFLSLAILTYFFTKASFENILTFLTKALLFILLVPIVDLVLSGTEVGALKYISIGANEFLITFFKLMNPLSGQGITVGQHAGAFFIFIAIAFFIHEKTGSFIKGTVSIFLGYAILFFHAVIPSVIVIFSGSSPMQNQTINDLYLSLLNKSWLMHAIENSDYLNRIFFQITSIHEIIMACFFWILVIIQITTIVFISNKRIWISLKNNLRIERVFYWLIIATIGIVINQGMFGDINLQNPINLILLLAFFMLIAVNIWLAVLINDAEDIAIDTISNPERPLVKKTVSEQEWRLMQIILLFLIAFGSAIMNRATAFLLLFAQGAYYIYSARPLRLKKHFLFSSALIGATSVFITMAGFFLVSPDQHFFAFPIKAAIIIGISYALLSNFKDIKDFEGDSHENMRTIPVVFGLKNAKRIIAALCAIVIVAIPLILKVYSMLFLSVCMALFVSYLFTKKKYQEKYVFLALFVYMIILFVLTR